MNTTDLQVIVDAVANIDGVITDVQNALNTLADNTSYAHLTPNNTNPTLADALTQVMSDYVQGQDPIFDDKLLELKNKITTDTSALFNLRDQLVIVLSTAGGTTDPLVLSQIQPDWTHLTAQFQAYLARKGSWKDMYVSGIGETLTEMVAAVAMFNQQGIEIAMREPFAPIARRDTSKYAGTEMLGVRIPRKAPAGVKTELIRTDYQLTVQNGVQIQVPATTGVNPVHTELDGVVPVDLIPNRVTVVHKGNQLTRIDLGFPGATEFKVSGAYIEFHLSMVNEKVDITYEVLPDPLSVPAYSVFSVDGATFFNRENFTFAPNVEEQELTLYEGLITEERHKANPDGFQIIALAPDEFRISEYDLQVWVVQPNNSTVLWDKTAEGLWAYGADDEVYFDRTNGRGITEILLGDGTHGKKIPGSTEIIVRYAETSGSLANRNDVGLKVMGRTFSQLEGTSVTPIAGGADEKPADFYAMVGPQIFNSKHRIVTLNDYRSHLLNYPNVADVLVKAQKDIAPDDVSWMNVVRFCILPQSGNYLADTEWTDLMTYLADRTHGQLRFTQIRPVRYPLAIRITAYIFSYVNVREVREPLRVAVSDLFSRQPGTLGRMVAVSDLVTATKLEGQVDHVEVLLNGDTRDLRMPDIYTFAELETLDINIQYTSRVVSIDYPEA